MGFAAPTKDMLGLSGDPATQRAKFLELSETLDKCLEHGLRGKMSGETAFVRPDPRGFDGPAGIVKTAQGRIRDENAIIEKYLSTEDVTKGVSADQLTALTSALATANVAKTDGWTLSNPLNVVPFGDQGLVPYNLSPVLQMIVPREMPLRNKTPRTKGVGTAINFRSITGVSNTASGGVANLSTFFSSASTTQAVGGVTWNRPPGITYAADSFTLSYAESGVSDYVTMQAEYASQGYTSLRSLSSLATLWASMTGDERNMLGGQITATSITSAAATIVADSTITASGLPGAAITAAYATFVSAASVAGVSGESQAITLTQSVTTSAGEGVKVSVLTSPPANAIGMYLYLNYSGTYYKGFTPFVKVGAYGVGSAPSSYTTVAALPSTSVDNGSNTPNGYDGYLSVLTNASLTGGHTSLNAALSTSAPGSEFQTVLVNLYETIGARPETIYTTPSIRSALAQAFQTAGGSSTGFRIVYDGTSNIAVGNFIDGIRNQATGDMVDLEVHRYMPAGVAMIISDTVPWADSGITNCWEINGVVDTVILEWPQTDLNYAMSSYSYNVLKYAAPGLSACITNINN